MCIPHHLKLLMLIQVKYVYFKGTQHKLPCKCHGLQADVRLAGNSCASLMIADSTIRTWVQVGRVMTTTFRLCTQLLGHGVLFQAS